MVQSQTIEQEADIIALADARQEEAEQKAEAEKTEAEEVEAAATEYIELAQKPSIGTVEFFLMVMLAFMFWLLALIPFIGFLFSGFGILSVWLWYKFKKLEPPSFGAAGQFSKIAGGQAGEFIKKIPGGSDFLFFFGAFTIDGIPFLDFIPALPALVILIYLANRG